VLGVERRLGPEPGELEVAAAVGDPLAQHLDGADPGDPVADPLEDRGLVLAAGILGLELLPGGGLGRAQEVEEDLLVEAEFAVEAFGAAFLVASGDQGLFDGGFEVLL